MKTYLIIAPYAISAMLVLGIFFVQFRSYNTHLELSKEISSVRQELELNKRNVNFYIESGSGGGLLGNSSFCMVLDNGEMISHRIGQDRQIVSGAFDKKETFKKQIGLEDSEINLVRNALIKLTYLEERINDYHRIKNITPLPYLEPIDAPRGYSIGYIQGKRISLGQFVELTYEVGDVPPIELQEARVLVGSINRILNRCY